MVSTLAARCSLLTRCSLAHSLLTFSLTVLRVLPFFFFHSGKTAKSFQTAAKEFEKELKEELKDDDEGGASKSVGSSSSSKDE